METQRTIETQSVTVLGVECIARESNTGAFRAIYRGKRNGVSVQLSDYVHASAQAPRWRACAWIDGIEIEAAHENDGVAVDELAKLVLAECPRIADRLGLVEVA